MISYPNAKINIGLYITAKRNDGFHSIKTILYPIKWCDVLEVLPDDSASKGITGFTISGYEIDVPVEENICSKVYSLLQKDHALPAIKVHLQKNIPVGAGLGGGSSDAASMLKMVNDMAGLHLSNDDLKSYASQLGSDCPFFIDNQTAFASGRGEILENVKMAFTDLQIVIVVPSIRVSTAWAYSKCTPKKVPSFLKKTLKKTPPEKWEGYLTNQFEPIVFNEHPEIGKIKDNMYKEGATYASLSGSGSAVYALFKKGQSTPYSYDDCVVWKGDL